MSYFSQLDLYDSTMFMQDHELISFADQYEVNGINYVGDTEYIESVLGRQSSLHYEMCVIVANSLFAFEQIIATCNNEIAKLPANGLPGATFKAMMQAKDWDYSNPNLSIEEKYCFLVLSNKEFSILS
jgi:hypothetical protein